jgi:hypothetical protein
MRAIAISLFICVGCFRFCAHRRDRSFLCIAEEFYGVSYVRAFFFQFVKVPLRERGIGDVKYRRYFET